MTRETPPPPPVRKMHLRSIKAFGELVRAAAPLYDSLIAPLAVVEVRDTKQNKLERQVACVACGAYVSQAAYLRHLDARCNAHPLCSFCVDVYISLTDCDVCPGALFGTLCW